MAMNVTLIIPWMIYHLQWSSPLLLYTVHNKLSFLNIQIYGSLNPAYLWLLRIDTAIHKCLFAYLAGRNGVAIDKLLRLMRKYALNNITIFLWRLCANISKVQCYINNKAACMETCVYRCTICVIHKTCDENHRCKKHLSKNKLMSYIWSLVTNNILFLVQIIGVCSN